MYKFKGKGCLTIEKYPSNILFDTKMYQIPKIIPFESPIFATERIFLFFEKFRDCEKTKIKIKIST